MFTHVSDLLSAHIDFIKNELSELFMKPGISDRLATIRRRCDPKGGSLMQKQYRSIVLMKNLSAEFLRGMIQMMQRRISKDATQLMNGMIYNASCEKNISD